LHLDILELRYIPGLPRIIRAAFNPKQLESLRIEANNQLKQ
jgi:hypothetical protein